MLQNAYVFLQRSVSRSIQLFKICFHYFIFKRKCYTVRAVVPDYFLLIWSKVYWKKTVIGLLETLKRPIDLRLFIKTHFRSTIKVSHCADIRLLEERCTFFAHILSIELWYALCRAVSSRVLRTLTTPNLGHLKNRKMSNYWRFTVCTLMNRYFTSNWMDELQND